MRNRRTFLAIALLALTCAGVGVFLVTQRPSVAVADDAYRTTSLNIISHTDPVDGTYPLVRANLGSTHADDDLLRIELFWTPVGGSEVQGATAEFNRTSSGNIYTSWSMPQEEFNSGTSLRVRFQAFDGSTPTLDYTRYLTIP
jgi:hypothetical protein